MKVNRAKIESSDIIMSIILFGVIVSASCAWSILFIDKYNYPKWIALCIGTTTALVFGGICAMRGKLYACNFYMLVCVIVTCIVALVLLCADSSHDIMACLIFACFLLACKSFQSCIDILMIAAMAFLSSAVISSILAVNQFIGGEEITGCYDNLVGFNLTLTLGVLSSMYLIAAHCHKRIYRVIIFVFVMLFLALIGMTQSRLAILSSIIGLIALYPNRKRHLFAIALSIILCITFLNDKKNESTFGRCFILKTSLSLLDSPVRQLFGYGEDGFGLNYMMRQADILKEETFQARQRASNIIHPLNEFVLVSIKYGIVVSVFVAVVFASFLFRKNTIPFARAILLVVIIYAMFSYPMRYPVSWIAVAIAFASCTKVRVGDKDIYTTTKHSLTLVHSLTSVIVGVVLLIGSWHSICMQRQWKMAYTQSVLGQRKMALENYRITSKYLKSNEFVFNYSSFLFNNGNSIEAITKLSTIGLRDYETIMLFGRIKASMNLYNDALSCFRIASDMCPNRFLPLFEMFKVYEMMNDVNGQEIYANIILNKHVKFQSSQIDYMVRYVSQKQRQLNK